MNQLKPKSKENFQFIHFNKYERLNAFLRSNITQYISGLGKVNLLFTTKKDTTHGKLLRIYKFRVETSQQKNLLINKVSIAPAIPMFLKDEQEILQRNQRQF